MKVKMSKGFTLAELLIVMAVITVLAAVSLPTFGKYIETARETADMEIIRSYYDETLSMAIIDAQDGTLDKKIKSDGTADITLTMSDGIATEDGLTYTVTLASVVPKTSFKQTVSGWQYISDSVGGKSVGAATTASTKIVYVYALNSAEGKDGTVQLTSITPGT